MNKKNRHTRSVSISATPRHSLGSASRRGAYSRILQGPFFPPRAPLHNKTSTCTPIGLFTELGSMATPLATRTHWCTMHEKSVPYSNQLNTTICVVALPHSYHFHKKSHRQPAKRAVYRKGSWSKAVGAIVRRLALFWLGYSGSREIRDSGRQANAGIHQEKDRTLVGWELSQTYV